MADTDALPFSDYQTTLRLNAEARLAEGTAPRAGRSTLGVEALELLHRRASDPDSASEALKLLHELQTHQVELDLLHEQLQANELEITEDLVHYRALFELAPAPYLVLDSDGRITQSNEAAGRLFGISPEQLLNQSVTELIAPSDRASVKRFIAALASPGGQSSCRAQLPEPNSLPGRLILNTRPVAEGTRILMVISQSDAEAAA